MLETARRANEIQESFASINGRENGIPRASTERPVLAGDGIDVDVTLTGPPEYAVYIPLPGSNMAGTNSTLAH